MARKISRKELLAEGLSELTAFAGAAVLSSGLVKLAFAEPGSSAEILVVLFLRGACDGLNLVCPLEGPDRAAYEAARPNLRVPIGGEQGAIALDPRFGLHPAARPLHELYQDKRCAIIHAAGLTSDSRSHFDAQAFMDLGTPGKKTSQSGWIARHLLSSAPRRAQEQSFLAAVSLGSLTPLSLLAYPEVAVINSLDGFNLAGGKALQNAQRDVLRRMYQGGGWLERYGTETLDAIDAFEGLQPGPAAKAEYPKGEIGNRLKTLAQLVKMDLGLKIAAVDMGGWDTHKYQGEGAGGYFANLVGQLSQSLAAFYQDLGEGSGAYAKRVSVVVMSEFGRRLKENASRGTDHGHGNLMLVLGEGIKGGLVHGRWPGLQTDQLYDRADLAVTTDFRQVLGELISRKLGNPKISEVFPGYGDYLPLGLIEGG